MSMQEKTEEIPEIDEGVETAGVNEADGGSADDGSRSEEALNGEAHSEDVAESDASGPAEAEEAKDPGEELEAMRDRYLRALAEVENVRKISERDRLEASKYGTTRLARDMLPIHDSLKRALASIDENQKEEMKALVEGIELTLRELVNAFAKHGIMPVVPEKGEAFDPKLHQAMFEAPLPDVEPGKIIEVMSEGFTICNRLLRPAHVGVASGRPDNVEVAKQS